MSGELVRAKKFSFNNGYSQLENFSSQALIPPASSLQDHALIKLLFRWKSLSRKSRKKEKLVFLCTMAVPQCNYTSNCIPVPKRPDTSKQNNLQNSYYFKTQLLTCILHIQTQTRCICWYSFADDNIGPYCGISARGGLYALMKWIDQATL